MDFNELYHKSLIETYHIFERFCRDNNLTFTAADGTLLGAVRHNGIIPWDDDIDVHMLRKDYNRFISMQEEAKQYGAEILSWETPGYGLPFSKFCNANTTIIPTKDSLISYGVFIDVMPLDEMSGTINQMMNATNRYRKLLGIYLMTKTNITLGIVINDLNNGFYLALIARVIARTLLRPFAKVFKNKIYSLEHSIKGEDYFISTLGTYGEKDIFPKDVYSTIRKVPFEDSYIYIPEKYDVSLTQLYKDYMQLPPVEKRVSNHAIYYANFNRRLNPADVA